MITLGIETSCDETAASVYDGKTILSNIVLSQIELHKEFGGVFPELAARRHLDHMLLVIDRALKEAQISKNDLDLISVASSPGLIGALLMGVNCAKSLGLALGIPVIGVNHVEAHLFANFLEFENEITFPALGLIVSGGHTALLYLEDKNNSKVLGTTLDDAIGECFDKVARMLDLPYPGGPEIEKIAKLGDPSIFNFKTPKIKNRPYDFSFSGLKTKVLYTLFGQDGIDGKKQVPKSSYPDIAASFQKAAFSSLINAINEAVENLNVNSILVGGGVSASSTLKQMLNTQLLSSVNVFIPDIKYSLDNGAMIAALGYHKFKQIGASNENLSASPSSRKHSFDFCQNS
ncbi:MAG: tRNA N6-adenosine threonylcarbamoyltransferase [Chlamydiia bacterium]|nr:tRNA N6-adenosine threonylcarbamoyltransferase [Chlamydiia bacterium]